MANRSIIIISVLLAILSLVGSFAINVASSNLPESWEPYLWLAYPISGGIVILTILFVVWQGVASVPVPPPPPRPAYVHEGWFLKHYYLAQDDFTGRKSELNFLTDWLQNKNNKPLLALIALGGFGKSALVWHWLNNEPAPRSLTKVIWWGFYDDNSFDTFLKETLEYLDIDPKALSLTEQVEMLARYIHQNRILIVMDGFERALRAYSSMNAAYQGDEEGKKEKTNNQCVSIHAGRFLERVAAINAQGRVLLTSRLLPDDLKIKGNENLLAGCLLYELVKLMKEDAVTFFRKQNIQGTRAEIEAACEVYEYHPLSLRLLSGRIVQERSRDIKLAEQFKIDADLKGRQNHILKVSYESLPSRRRLLLSKIATFRSPMTLEDIKVFEEKPVWWRKILFGEDNLQNALNDLVSRGLVHHDPNKDKYDLHPIVRRYAYDRLTAPERTGVHAVLIIYFDAVPKPQKVEKLEDLDLVIELYHHTVRAGKLDEARELYRDRLADPIYFQFGAYQTEIELLRALFLDGEDKPPRLKDESAQAWTLNSLAASYSLSGQPRRAVPLLEMVNALKEKAGDKKNLAIGLGNVASMAQIHIGALSEAERNLRRRIDLCREVEDEENEGTGHYERGRVLAYAGQWEESEKALNAGEEIKKKTNHIQAQSVIWSYRALRFLLLGRQTADDRQSSIVHCQSSIECAQRALELADETAKPNSGFVYPISDYIRAYWLLGAAYRANNELGKAEENLTKALNLCRQINLVADEADILLDLSKLRHAQSNSAEALRLAQEALFITERSGYVLTGADVHLMLATLAVEGDALSPSKGHRSKVEGGLSDKEAAIYHAKEALRLATCEGPPYYYKVAYEEAEAMLEKLK